MTEPSEHFITEFQNTSDENVLLDGLKDIASRPAVGGVAVRCLQLLNHENAEVRDWAVECLSESVQPATDETDAIFAITKRLLEPNVSSIAVDATASDDASDHVDTLYWCVTLIGRFEWEGLENRQTAIDWLARVASTLDSPAADRAKRILDRMMPR